MSRQIIVGLDNGFGQVKAVTSQGRQTIFPSLVASALPSLGITPEYSLVRIKEGDFLVGEAARDYAKASDSRVGGLWIYSTPYKVLAFNAFNQLGVKQGILVTGLSVEYYLDLHNELEREVAKWKVEGYDFKLADTHPQPAGTFWDLAIDAQGNFDEEFTEQRVAVVDIGHGTLDLMELFKSDPTQSHYSTPFGLHTAYLALLQHILVKHSEAFSMADMPAVMREGVIRVESKTINLNRIIDEIKQKYVAYVYYVMRELWPTLDRMDKVVLTGGGAQLIADSLEKRLKRSPGTVVVPPASDIANARGYVKHAMALDLGDATHG